MSHGRRYAVYPLGCLMIVGFPFAVLHQTSCPTDYECQACEHKFGVRSLLGRFCLGLIYLIVLAIAFAIVSVFVELS